MAKTFPLQILKITETIFDGEALSVTLPSRVGEITVMADHETMLTSLQAGTITLRQEGEEDTQYEVTHGFLEATPEKVTILL